MPAKARLLIRRPDFSIVGIEDSPLTFECSRTENAVGAFMATMLMRPDYDQISADYMLELQRSFDDGRHYINDTKTLWLARSVTLAVDERGRETIELAGTDLLGLLDRRIVAWFAVTASDNGQNYYSCKTLPACDMIRQIVSENFTIVATQAAVASDYPGSVHTPGVVDEADRVMSFMGVEASAGDGPTLTQEFAWAVVGDALRQIVDAAYAEDGHRIVFDIEWDAQATPPMTFRTRQGALGIDRTASMLFSVAIGNIVDLKMKLDRTTEVTWMHVGGKGTADLRLVQAVVDTANFKKTPFYPIEGFTDKSDSSDAEVLRKAGDVEMRRRRARWIFAGTARNMNGCTFGVDYGYGDLVRVTHRGIAATCRVATFRLRYEAGRETVELPLSSEDEAT